MKRILIAVVGMTAALSLAACGSDSETPTATETVTVAPSPAPEPTPPPSPTTEISDAEFAAFIRENTDAFDNATDQEIVNVALSICAMWEDGATVEDVIKVVADSGVDPYDGGYLAGAGTEAYCPQYSDNFDSGSSA